MGENGIGGHETIRESSWPHLVSGMTSFNSSRTSTCKKSDMEMSSPTSPKHYSIFMVKLKNEAMVTTHHKLGFWLRYVSDTFTLWNKKHWTIPVSYMTKPSHIVHYENWKLGTLTFLDANVKWNNNNLRFTVQIRNTSGPRDNMYSKIT